MWGNLKMLDEYDLVDLNNLSYDANGEGANPMIYVKSDCHKKILSPSNIYIDDDGDIVIEVPCDYLTEI